MAVAVSPASDAIDCLSRLSLGPPTHPEHLLSHRLEPFAMAMHLTSCIRIVGDDSKTCWRRDAATLRWRALWPLPKTLPAKSFRNSCSQGLEHPLYQSCIVISEVADFVIIVIVVAVMLLSSAGSSCHNARRDTVVEVWQKRDRLYMVS
jgi:hypothetical protein